MEGSGHAGGRGLRRNAIGLPGWCVVDNIDVFAPARDDYLHLLRWMR